MSLGISSRQSAALVISHFPQAHAPHPCEVFLLYKRSLSFKTNKKEARSQASSPAAGRLISPILFQPMAILAERFYVIGRTVLWHKKKRRSLSYTKTYSAVFSLDCNCSGRGILSSGKVEQEASEIPPMWDLAGQSAYKQAWYRFFRHIYCRPE